MWKWCTWKRKEWLCKEMVNIIECYLIPCGGRFGKAEKLKKKTNYTKKANSISVFYHAGQLGFEQMRFLNSGNIRRKTVSDWQRSEFQYTIWMSLHNGSTAENESDHTSQTAKSATVLHTQSEQPAGIIFFIIYFIKVKNENLQENFDVFIF